MMATNATDTGLDLDNEDRLPWLEAADTYDEDEAVSPARLLALVLGGLVLIGAVLGGLWYLQGGREGGKGELIAAQSGPYKQPPVDDGAKQFEGEGDSSFAASEGAEPSGKLDPAKMPEAPAITPPKMASAEKGPAPVPAPTKAAPPSGQSATAKGPAPVAKAPIVTSKAPPPKAAAAAPVAKAPPPKAAPAAGSATVQLGAFSSEDSAAKAWTSLSKRFAYLQGLGKSVAPATVNGKTVYRLRATTASPASAADICGKLRVAGENCSVVR